MTKKKKKTRGGVAPRTGGDFATIFTLLALLRSPVINEWCGKIATATARYLFNQILTAC